MFSLMLMDIGFYAFIKVQHVRVNISRPIDALSLGVTRANFAQLTDPIG